MPGLEHQVVQVNFTGGINPSAPAHLVADNEVVTATNIDFGLIEGALSPRRGSQLQNLINSGHSIFTLFRNYNNDASIASNQFYAIDDIGTVWRGSAGGSFSSILTGAAFGGDPSGISSFNQYAIIMSGGQKYKDDGTNTTELIKQVPAAPTVTISTLTGADLTNAGANTFTVTVGTLISSASTTMVFQTDATSFAAQLLLNFASTPVNLNTNGTNTIGNFGVHFVDLSLVSLIKLPMSRGIIVLAC